MEADQKIVGACLFYGALCYFISLAIPPFNSEGFSFLTLLERMYPGNWWFLMEYIVLILLSPMLNKSIENIDSKTFRLYIILLLISTSESAIASTIGSIKPDIT